MKHEKERTARRDKNGTIYAYGKFWTEETLAKYRIYQEKHRKAHYRACNIRFSKVSDLKLIEYIESQENIIDYFRQLIKADMEAKGLRTEPTEEEKMKAQAEVEEAMMKYLTPDVKKYLEENGEEPENE